MGVIPSDALYSAMIFSILSRSDSLAPSMVIILAPSVSGLPFIISAYITIKVGVRFDYEATLETDIDGCNISRSRIHRRIIFRSRFEEYLTTIASSTCTTAPILGCRYRGFQVGFR